MYFFIIKSVLSTAQRAAIVSGVELAAYDWVKKQLIYRFNSSDTIGTHFIASFTAGFAGAVASTPIDVVRVSYNILCILLVFLVCCFKTRLMNQENIHPRFNSTLTSTRYKGIMDCFVKVRFIFVHQY